MFFKPNTFKSSNVRSIMLNPSTNQVIVQYINNAKTYLYDNVSADAITEFFFGEYESVGKFVNAYCKPNMTTVIGWFLSLIKQHLYNTMLLTAPEMTDMQQRVSEMLCSDNIERIDKFINELDDYGIDTEEQIDDAYYGCYPSCENFVEDLCEDCYKDVIDAMPTFMQSALDYELMWHQSFQHDFFTVYDRDSGDYYFFNRNF